MLNDIKFFLNNYFENINNEKELVKKDQITERIWKKDYTVWNDDPIEISNRLGWLDCPSKYQDSVDDINSFVNEIKREGYTNALLLGMGGSSLAPGVFRFTFGVRDGYPDLNVLDSTHPDAIKEISKNLNVEKTLFIVSTKSGGTIETISFMKYFYTLTSKKLGLEKAGRHFAAITDHGSGLEKMAIELKFRKIFLNDPNIGGRYSALSLFGIVPAALVGINIAEILRRAEKETRESKKEYDFNPAIQLGVTTGVLANQGKDKLTFITSPQLKHFGAWVEQLIAESTGKIGKGILPVDLEELLSADNYSDDRVFVYWKLKNDSTLNNSIKKLSENNFPVIIIELKDLYDLGTEYFRWELATAVAGWVLRIQPFDQPNVESAKVLARKLIKEYTDKGVLPALTPSFEENGVKVTTELKTDNIKDAIYEFLSQIKESKSYVAIQAYLKPDEQITALLHSFRTLIQKKYSVATTVGYGPRFLHSTGQLHKGDSGNGLFIQFINKPVNEVQIPDEAGKEKSSLTFNTLIKAQALGDRNALLDNERKVITLDLGENSIEALENINKLI